MIQLLGILIVIRSSEHWSAPLSLAILDLKTSQLPVCLRPNPWSWASQQSSGKQAAVPGPRSPGCIILWTWYSFRLKKKEMGSFIREQELLPRRHTWTPGWHSNEQMVHPGKKASVLLNPQTNPQQPSRWWWGAWRGSDPAGSWNRGSRRIGSSCGLWCVGPGGFDESKSSEAPRPVIQGLSKVRSISIK